MLERSGFGSFREIRLGIFSLVHLPYENPEARWARPVALVYHQADLHIQLMSSSQLKFITVPNRGSCGAIRCFVQPQELYISRVQPLTARATYSQIVFPGFLLPVDGNSCS